MDTRCRSTRRDGARCQGKARASGFCFAHDDALRQARSAGNTQGGRNKATATRLDKIVPATLKPVLSKLLTAMDDTCDGTMEARQATALASLAGAVVRVYELAALEERLNRLEEQTGQNERKGG